MMDSNFTFGATGGGPGPHPSHPDSYETGLTPEQAVQLAADRDALIAALGMIRTDGPRHFLGEAPTRFGWNWWVADLTTGDKLVEGRARTKWGMWRRRYRAYQRVLIAEKAQPACAADPTCQHYVPFGVVCGQCPPRADS